MMRPYRIGPNMMVVVPTSNHVELTYGRSTSDYVTILLSLVGIALCFVWRRQGDVVHASEEPAAWWWRSDTAGGAPLDDGVDQDVDGERDRDLDDEFADEFDDRFDAVSDADEADVSVGDESPDLGFRRPDPSGDTSEPTDNDR